MGGCQWRPIKVSVLERPLGFGSRGSSQHLVMEWSSSRQDFSFKNLPN